MAHDLTALTRPSGGFAMLAVDQREALRAMFAEHQDEPVTDEDVTRFKLAATRTLTPHASGVLLDRQFVLDRAIAESAVSPGCGLIAAADRFVPAYGEFVGEVEIDESVDPARYAELGAVAMKLLVPYRPDQPSAHRVPMVERFVDRCRAAGLLSIIEPVSRPPVDQRPWQRDGGVLAAARELGRLGADLYKAEVPLRGEGPADQVRRHCARITEAVDSPWVVLSSGVAHETFPEAVRLACGEGASGFLAGRAVWRTVVGSADPAAELAGPATARLRELGEIVDASIAAPVGR